MYVTTDVAVLTYNQTGDIWIFITALFMISKNRKYPKCPTLGTN